VAQRVGRGIALLFQNRSTRRPRFIPGKDPVPVLQEAGCATGPVWTGGKTRPYRDSIADLPARSQSLYRLSYRAHICCTKCSKIGFIEGKNGVHFLLPPHRELPLVERKVAVPLSRCSHAVNMAPKYLEDQEITLKSRMGLRRKSSPLNGAVDGSNRSR
jgi:hypothetical protein